ncbi:hypothetical protein NDU88_005663 [Pleurodeles waltl]|uniref:Uncharacterized protein n=1 Tax=Pleurodeles waltl TaxID=8319 RepID=A0AAV7MAN2_PLEWA|nr:hypothetical protein NDU88_005663 [Pleurodeles waltl]
MRRQRAMPEALHRLERYGTHEDLSQILEAPIDNPNPSTKGDIQLLLAEFHKDINALGQDFTLSMSNLVELVRQIDSHLTTVESADADQVMENLDHTARIEKLQANYNLLQGKQDDLENWSRCNNICIRGIGVDVPASDLKAHIQALFTHLLGPDCD